MHKEYIQYTIAKVGQFKHGIRLSVILRIYRAEESFRTSRAFRAAHVTRVGSNRTLTAQNRLVELLELSFKKSEKWT